MKHIMLFVAGWAVVAAAAPAQDGPVLHDPVAELAKAADAETKAVLDAIEARDAGAILRGIEGQDERKAGGPDGRYAFALGVLEVLGIERSFERNSPDSLPDALRGIDLDALAARAIEAAEGYAKDHPEHSDVERVRGEILSFTIRGMTSGLTQGPKAKAAIERALAKDPGNAWAIFALGRMHYHNPSFAGGDLDRSIEEFRSVADKVPAFRPTLYLGLAYQAKGMLPQARFWARKALSIHSSDPEAKQLLADVEAEMEEDR